MFFIFFSRYLDLYQPTYTLGIHQIKDCKVSLLFGWLVSFLVCAPYATILKWSVLSLRRLYISQVIGN